jgi:hypothetical protein
MGQNHEFKSFSSTAIGHITPVHMLLAYYDLCWFVSSCDDNLKLEENKPRDYLVSPTNKMKIKREREREVNTETVGAAGHGLYRCLWAIRTCSA